MKKICLLLLLIGQFSYGQDHLSSFNMTSLTYKPSSKWMLYLELQDRSRRDYSVIDYYETKGGVGYNFIKNNQFFIGLGRYGVYENKKISLEEFRIWLQYTFTQRFGKLKLEHRARAEQRFFHNSQTGENTKTNRYRYRLNAVLPLNKDKVQDKTFFANVFEEVFFGPLSPNFKRNRTFAGFGYQINHHLSATTGYLFQREFSTKKNENFHFLYFAINFTIDRTKEEKDIVIHAVD